MWFLLHSAYIIYDGLQCSEKTADAAVILGTTVNGDGTLSERLKQRVDCGLNLYKDQRVRLLIVSGGLGKEGHYEGDKMAEYLVRNGVPIKNIVIDNRGNNTRATADNILKLQDSLQIKSIIVVSQYFHITRTKMLLRKRGFEKVAGASPRYFEFRDLFSVVREFPAYYTQ
ncbi:YdcF family protein [Flavobacterium sp. MFBS3-15]|uniref:YdcF family protein n=1 Tax=Flavobacterium sp. MFBS3-15 TaxID=2989816 RepID=UPI002236B5FD|nr:YdcF family protein [Flavobacterium sp. MFBS3-15]MCW4469723.1 YdcF family protein [Flavobacterium sp. MFBS3-15]